ncbi:MAG: ABC-F family ATP-binding cassette domain-containing protein [Kiritimatiellaeota bacterium]|nr:ABC-F family ATP-binding cassette domain-containing protein [Kiritimatiellota bacterium]
MIIFENVCKQYGPQVVLRDVSFRVHPGERVGVVGPNGAGKSTLFGMITGAVSPDRGEVRLRNGLRLGHVRQQLGRPPERRASVLEYTENALPELQRIERALEELEERLARNGRGGEDDLRRLGELQTRFEHLGGYRLRNRAEAVLSGLGFAAEQFQRPFAEFSGGWQMRAELARALTATPDILLLDEPTNYLDVPAVEWLQGFLRGFTGTLLLISHDRFLLNSLTTTTLEALAGNVTRYPGNYDAYVAGRGQRREQAEAARRNSERRRRQIERFVERFRAKNTKSSQVQSRIKMLERMDAEEKKVAPAPPPLPQWDLRLPQPARSGLEVARLDDVGLSYDGGRTWVFRGVSLRIERGERLAVVGLNGMGKTTLLRILAGRLEPSEGRCRIGARVLRGYVAQDSSQTLDGNRTVFETALAARGEHGLTAGEVRSFLGAFRFSAEAIDKPVDVLSGGEKVRLSLACVLLDPPNFLILDEPTTHLDIPSRQALEQALTRYAGTLCLVSHDIAFVRAVAQGILSMDERGVRRYFGGYDYFREKRAAELAESPLPGERRRAEDRASADARRLKRQRAARRRQELYRERRPLEQQMNAAEARVTRLEAEREDILAELSTGAAAGRRAELNRRLGEIGTEIQHVTTEWEDAAVALEDLLEQFGGS